MNSTKLINRACLTPLSAKEARVVKRFRDHVEITLKNLFKVGIDVLDNGARRNDVKLIWYDFAIFLTREYLHESDSVELFVRALREYCWYYNYTKADYDILIDQVSRRDFSIFF